jgi:hypothetical protein
MLKKLCNTAKIQKKRLKYLEIFNIIFYLYIHFEIVMFVPEISNVSHADTHLALGFNLPENLTKNVDQRLPTDGMPKFKGSFGKLFTKGNAGANVKLYKTKCLDNFTHYSLPSEMSQFAQTFNKPEENTKFVVKVTPISRYRALLTCFKEAHMTNNIHNTVRDDINGADVVCKPYMCIPVYTNTKWKFVFVSSFASGVPVANLLNPLYRGLHWLCKYEIYQNLSKACDIFWKLGFAHNDLHPNNILYDLKTKKITFIDLETSVQLTSDVIQSYNEDRVRRPNTSCNFAFNYTMQQPALHMLRHSEKWLHQFTTQKKNHVPMLYNNDTEFLDKIQEIMNI